MGALLGATGLLATSGTAAGQQAQEVDYGGWFSNVSNFDGTVDRTGESEVVVEVGTQANGGYYGFSPAAIRVDPGTTVRFVWTGQGGAHTVTAENNGYDSGLFSEKGHEFTHTYEEQKVSLYYCTPHRPLGMKGAVVVGDAMAVPQSGGTLWSPPDLFDTTIVSMFFGVLAVAGLGVLGAEAYARRQERFAELAPDGPVEETTEADPAEPEREITHEEYDPIGTGALIVMYFLILVALWVFVYFIEFLGNGPTVVG
ncbi:MAG: halocyanin domain-containing protein [Halobacteriaceae archaeon]